MSSHPGQAWIFLRAGLEITTNTVANGTKTFNLVTKNPSLATLKKKIKGEKQFPKFCFCFSAKVQE